MQTTFLIYAMVFRLAIIASGIVSIVLGYKLFLRLKTPPSKKNASGTDAHADIHKGTFGITNAAPGTLFALFGATIISVMLYQGNPEYLKKDISDSDDGERKKGEIERIRSGSKLSMDEAFARAQNSEKSDAMTAIKEYRECLNKVAEPMNNLASLYLKQKEYEKAEALANLAIVMNPEEGVYYYTMYEILSAKGNPDAALKHLQSAARFMPEKYQSRLLKVQSQRGTQ